MRVKSSPEMLTGPKSKVQVVHNQPCLCLIYRADSYVETQKSSYSGRAVNAADVRQKSNVFHSGPAEKLIEQNR
jgi:hypothetical protein